MWQCNCYILEEAYQITQFTFCIVPHAYKATGSNEHPDPAHSALISISIAIPTCMYQNESKENTKGLVNIS